MRVKGCFGGLIEACELSLITVTFAYAADINMHRPIVTMSFLCVTFVSCRSKL